VLYLSLLLLLGVTIIPGKFFQGERKQPPYDHFPALAYVTFSSISRAKASSNTKCRTMGLSPKFAHNECEGELLRLT
jgi:hypothetical protein